MILNSPTISGSLTVTGNIISSGSITLSGSVASASYATSASNATNAISASYANNLTVAGTLTAQTLVVQTITSSVEYITGSSINGSLNSNTHLFTGSVSISGSSTFALNVNSGSLFVSSSGQVGIGTITPTKKLTVKDSTAIQALFQGYTSLGPKVDDESGEIQLGSNNTYAGRIAFSSTGSTILSIDNTYNGDAAVTQFRMKTNATAVTAMTITGVGNVGIGITPSYALDVANSSSPSIRVRNSALGGTATLLLETANNFSGTCQTYIQCIGSTGNGTSQLAFATSRANGDTTATEAMRITSGGALVINGTTAVLTSTNRGNITLSGTASSLLGFSNGTSYTGYIYNDYGANLFQWVSAGNTIQVVCSSNGVQLTSGATSWSSISDERLKNITGNIENAVNSLMTLRTIKHTWKSDDTNKENLGLIAQDVQKVFPQVIDINKLPSKLDDEQKDETKYLAVRYTELVPVLVKAIQELKTQNDALQSRIETLESK